MSESKAEEFARLAKTIATTDGEDYDWAALEMDRFQRENRSLIEKSLRVIETMQKLAADSRFRNLIPSDILREVSE